MAWPDDALKHCILKLARVTFSSGQKQQNKFEHAEDLLKQDPLKHRLLDLGQVTFLDGQKNTKLFRRARRPLETSFSRPRSSCILGRPGGKSEFAVQATS